MTARLATCFDEVVTTERSPWLARRLRRGGFRCHIGEDDVVIVAQRRASEVAAAPQAPEVVHRARVVVRDQELRHGPISGDAQTGR